MAYFPVALTPPQFVDSNGDPYSGAVLKYYQAGTTTNLQIATDSTGGTLVNTMTLNASGYPEVSGNVVIPHVNASHKPALYATQAAADADSGAIWSPDNITPTGISTDIPDAVSTLTSLRNYGGAATTVILKGGATERDGAGSIYGYVSGAAAGTYTDDGRDIIVPSGGDGSAAWLIVPTINSGSNFIQVDNLSLDGNTVSSTNTNGNITLTPNGSGNVVLDNISVNDNVIASTQTNANILLSPNGTGEVRASGQRVLTVADEGAGNGLDADTVDGNEATALYSRANHTGTQLMSTISNAGTLATLNSVGEAQIDAGAIHKSELDTTSTEASSSVGIGEANAAFIGLSSHEYFMGYEIKAGNVTGLESRIEGSNTSTSAYKEMEIMIWGTSDSQTGFVQYYTVTGSPPYDHGFGQIPGFLFLLMNRDGSIDRTYLSQDPPWIHLSNYSKYPKVIQDGKLYRVVPKFVCEKQDIAAQCQDSKKRETFLQGIKKRESELVPVTYEMKKDGMQLKPHPFSNVDMTDKTPVCVKSDDTVLADLIELYSQTVHEDFSVTADIILSNYIKFGNEHIDRGMHKSVQCITAKWKNTRGG